MRRNRDDGVRGQGLVVCVLVGVLAGGCEPALLDVGRVTSELPGQGDARPPDRPDAGGGVVRDAGAPGDARVEGEGGPSRPPTGSRSDCVRIPSAVGGMTPSSPVVPQPLGDFACEDPDGGVPPVTQVLSLDGGTPWMEAKQAHSLHLRQAMASPQVILSGSRDPCETELLYQSPVALPFVSPPLNECLDFTPSEDVLYLRVSGSLYGGTVEVCPGSCASFGE